MSDLAGGRYPDSEEEWLLDGSPIPPYRRTISRRDIAAGSTGIAMTQATLFVYAVPVQAGDIFDFVSLLCKTATATPTHSWVAIYNGMTTAATLLAQSTDATGGFTVGANKLQLASVVSNVGTVGTPQGPSTGAIVAQGPAVWGLAIYNSGATGAVLDGMPGGNVAGAIALTGQLPLAMSASLAATATAPATLSGLSAASGAVPYAVLSRN
jgi:hypothetical protein